MRPIIPLVIDPEVSYGIFELKLAHPTSLDEMRQAFLQSLFAKSIESFSITSKTVVTVC
jgi:hypothetical protein